MRLKGGSSLWVGGGLVATAILVAILAPWIALTDPVMGANLMNAEIPPDWEYPFGTDAQGRDMTREVSMVKAYCGELVNEVMYACLQYHGGFGYMREAAIERMARDARIQSIGGGATEVMLEEIAKRM